MTYQYDPSDMDLLKKKKTLVDCCIFLRLRSWTFYTNTSGDCYLIVTYSAGNWRQDYESQRYHSDVDYAS